MSSRRSDRRSGREARSQRESKNDQPEATSLLSPPRGAKDGVANAEPGAISSSPLLVRPDRDAANQARADSPRRKPRQKTRLLSTGANPFSREQPTAKPPAEDTPSTLTRANTLRRTVSNLNLQPTSMWGLISSCMCFGGSFRPLLSLTELPRLSPEANHALSTLDSVTRKSHVEVFVRHTDNMPFGTTSTSSRYERPQIVVHLVDVCTGRPMAKPHPFSPAKFSKQLLNAFEWNMPHTWSKVHLTDFLSPKTIVLIEVLQLRKPPKSTTSILHRNTQRNDASREKKNLTKAKRLAWCFFKPISDQGNIRLPRRALAEDSSSNNNNDHDDDDVTVRLQLHAWHPLSWIDTQQARSQFMWYPSAIESATAVPTVFLQYQRRTRTKLPCSLHVAIRPIVSLQGTLSPRLSAIDEQIAERASISEPVTVGDNQIPPDTSSSPSLHDSASVNLKSEPPPSAIDVLVRCKRNTGEPCLVPQRVLHRLPTGRQGCSCVAFSPDGVFLAAAIHHVSATADEWAIHIHVVNSGVLWQRCRGHVGMIYTLEWGLLSSGVKALVSASSDGTAMLWHLRETMLSASSTTTSTQPQRTWHHVPTPTYVYTAIFHATQPRLVVTGASDGVIRLWDVESSSTTATPVSQWPATPSSTLSTSASTPAVHSLCMESKTARLFCGDASGCIHVYDASSPTACVHLKTVRTGHSSVASVRLHPRKKHLLVLTHPHALLHYELRSFLLLHKHYSGIECDQLLVKATFSADGQYVACGSEDGIPHLFASVQGTRVTESSTTTHIGGVWNARFFHGYPVMEIAWSPSTHIVAMAAYGANHPIVVLGAYREDRTFHEEDMENNNVSVQSSGSGDQARQRRRFQSRERSLDPGPSSGRGKMATDGTHHPDPAEVDPEGLAARTLQRRQQRLQAKLARELDAAPRLSDNNTTTSAESTMTRGETLSQRPSGPTEVGNNNLHTDA